MITWWTYLDTRMSITVGKIAYNLSSIGIYLSHGAMNAIVTGEVNFRVFRKTVEQLASHKKSFFWQEGN